MKIKFDKVLRVLKNNDWIVSGDYTFIDRDAFNEEFENYGHTIFVMREKKLFAVAQQGSKPFTYFGGRAMKIRIYTDCLNKQTINGGKNGIYDIEKGLVFESEDDITVTPFGFETNKPYLANCKKTFNKSGMMTKMELQETCKQNDNRTIVTIDEKGDINLS